MPKSETYMVTPQAERYRAQLAKHFAHKIAVIEEEGTSRFIFPMGRGAASSAPGSLSLSAEANGPEDLARVQQVLESHLLCFACRETPPPLEWVSREE